MVGTARRSVNARRRCRRTRSAVGERFQDQMREREPNWIGQRTRSPVEEALGGQQQPRFGGLERRQHRRESALVLENRRRVVVASSGIASQIELRFTSNKRQEAGGSSSGPVRTGLPLADGLLADAKLSGQCALGVPEVVSQRANGVGVPVEGVVGGQYLKRHGTKLPRLCRDPQAHLVADSAVFRVHDACGGLSRT